MRLLKKTFLFFIIIGSFGYSAFVLFKPPCSSPLRYSIGSFDSKFNISRVDFQDAMAQAEKIWEDSVGKDLFEYSVDGGLPVNLVYDARQEIADKNKRLESHIDETAKSAAPIKQEFAALKDRLEASKALYEAAVKEYASRQDAYNAEVNAWNKKGGAPKEAYDALTREKAALVELRAALEQKRSVTNSLADQVNALIQKYNYLVDIENTSIREINRSADKEFEQGEYISDAKGQRINMYEFTDRTELVRTLAHEFGHALGLDHNQNPESIMYYLNKGKNLSLSQDDTAALRTQCEID